MYTLLIPKNQIRKENKSGGNSFWHSFWKEKVSENVGFYKNQYKERIENQKEKIKRINEANISNNKRQYIDIVLSEEKKSSKSNIPSDIWLESGLKVVSTKEKNGKTILTLGGKTEDYKALENILNQTNFDVAQIVSGSKNTTISREVYAVTDIQSKSNTPDGRISSSLQKILDNNYADEIDCIIEVHSDVPISEYDSIYDELIKFLGSEKVEKRDRSLFIHNFSYFGKINIEEILQILSTPEFSYLNKIKLNPIFSAQRSVPSTNFSNVNIGNCLTNEMVGVMDSGIDNTLFNHLVGHKLNYLKNGLITDNSHGTNVSSRLLFGEDFFEKINNGEVIFPSTRIVDIKVLHKKSTGEIGTDIESLTKAIKESPNKLSDVTIYNLSISTKDPLEDDSFFEELTQMVDTISSEKDVLFIIAAGNHMGNLGLNYNDVFNLDEAYSNITSPADSINSICVGSTSKTADKNTICEKVGLPSPISRKGGIRKDMKKPDLVCGGGNIEIDSTQKYDYNHLNNSKSKYGVDVMSQSNFSKDIGTSLSVPLITRQAVLLLDYFKKSNLPEKVEHFETNKSNLLRVALVHSTSKRKQEKIHNEGVKRAFGFGEPEFEKGVLDDDKNQISIVYANRIFDTEKKHKLDLKIPQDFLGKNIEVTLTFAYNPPVNKNIKEYKLIDLKPTLRTATPILNESDDFEDMKYDPKTPSHSWKNHRSNPFSTLVHFKKVITPLNSVDLELLVTMTISSFLDKKSGQDEIFQDYAFIFSIKDLEGQGILRDRIVQENELEELIQAEVEVNH